MLRKRVFLLTFTSLLALSLTAFASCGEAATPTDVAAAPQNPTATNNAVPSGHTFAAPQNPSATGIANAPKNTSAGPERDNIEPREVFTGEEFPIILKEDSGSGYQWDANFDASCLSLVSAKYVTPATTGTGGGERDFQFKALKRGLSSVVMLLRRPGDEVPKDSKILLFGIDQTFPNFIEDGGPASANVGGEFTLSVEENPTGERWEAAPDSAYLQLVSSTHAQNSETRTFQFRALKQGVTGLVLVLNKLPEGTPLEIRVDMVAIN